MVGDVLSLDAEIAQRQRHHDGCPHGAKGENTEHAAIGLHLTMRPDTDHPPHTGPEHRTEANDAPHHPVRLPLPPLHEPQLSRQQAEREGVKENVHFEPGEYPGLEGVAIKQRNRPGHMAWIIKV